MFRLRQNRSSMLRVFGSPKAARRRPSWFVTPIRLLSSPFFFFSSPSRHPSPDHSLKKVVNCERFTPNLSKASGELGQYRPQSHRPGCRVCRGLGQVRAHKAIPRPLPHPAPHAAPQEVSLFSDVSKDDETLDFLFEGFIDPLGLESWDFNWGHFIWRNDARDTQLAWISIAGIERTLRQLQYHGRA